MTFVEKIAATISLLAGFTVGITGILMVIAITLLPTAALVTVIYLLYKAVGG